MNPKWLVKILMTTAMIFLATAMAEAQTREVLFDGKTLTGWHTQGPGTWSVTEGRIHALNPQKQWGHLVTDKTYKDGYVRFKFLDVVGNSGLYVRGTEGGEFGVKGMQVDIGFAQDGSVMRVTDTTWAWIQLITKAMDSAYLKAGAWNELAVDMQGTSLKTYINGKLIWSGTNIAGMAASGVLALQLHNGDNNDIYFKDVEILLPTRVPHCPDPANVAYKPGNDPDSSLCKTVGIRRDGKALDPNGASQSPGWMMRRGFYFNLLGMRVPLSPAQSLRIKREGGSK